MKFSNERLEIPEDKKIFLWRFLDKDKAPFAGSFKDPEGSNGFFWDLTAKSVTDYEVGIFGVNEEQAVKLYNNGHLNMNIIMIPNPTFLRIEADVRNIVAVNFNETAVSECNILEVLNKDEFFKRFPLYPLSFEWLYRRVGGGAPFLRNSFNLMQEMTKNQMNRILDIGSPHGYIHSMRVDVNIQILGEKLGLDRDDVNTMADQFAHWHDIMRFNNGNDPQHGQRAGEAIKRNRNHINLQPVRDDLIDRVIYACEHHTTMHKSGDPLIDICFDGNRMDLTRVGIQPDPKQMATEAGAYFASNYHEYVNELQNFDYQAVR
jgi:uncharacterized protein